MVGVVNTTVTGIPFRNYFPGTAPNWGVSWFTRNERPGVATAYAAMALELPYV